MVRNSTLAALALPFLASTALAGITAGSDSESPIPKVARAEENEAVPAPTSNPALRETQSLPASEPAPARDISSEIEKAIAGCSSLTGDLDRLECFDQLARDLGLGSPQPVPLAIDGIGKWKVETQHNSVDDTASVFLQLAADEGWSKSGRPVYMVVRCKSDRTDMFIAWDSHLADDGREHQKRVVTRIGRESAQTDWWNVSTDQQATFAPGWGGDWLKRMVRHETFVAQVTPYNEIPITAVFDIRGLEQALQPLMEACDWSLQD